MSHLGTYKCKDKTNGIARFLAVTFSKYIFTVNYNSQGHTWSIWCKPLKAGTVSDDRLVQHIHTFQLCAEAYIAGWDDRPTYIKHE